MKYLRYLRPLIVLVGLNYCLVGCGSSSSSGSTNDILGSLVFSQSNLSVTTGSSNTVTLSLIGSMHVNGLNVRLTSSNTSIATVSPVTCVLSSPPGSPQDCTVIVSGVSNGSATITASADRYTPVVLDVVVSSSTIPGALFFSPASESVTTGSSNYFILGLSGSSGISNLQVNLASANSSIATISPTSCILNSESNVGCLVNVSGISNGTTNITATASGYTVAPAVIMVSPNPVPGSISFGNTSLNASVSQSVSVSLVLKNSSGISNQIVNLSSANPAIATVSPSSCSLSSTPGNRTCLVTITANESGSTKINATSSGYTIAPVNITVAGQGVYSRTFKFINNCSQPVWFGSTGGATNSLINGNDSRSTACAPSLADAVCPSGSTCRNSGDAGYICYFNPLQPTNNNFKIESGTSMVIGIPSSSYDPANDYVWSGNTFGRQQCNEATGSCVVASCTTESGSMQCLDGASPPVTLAEITMLRGNPDSYDISIINGINTGMEFGPNNTIYTSGQTPYNCGTAGSVATETSAGFSIPGSSWQFHASGSSGITDVYFNWVSGDGSASACTTDSQCSSPMVCGYTTNAIVSLGGALPVANYKLTCGARMGYWSAAQIWFYNESMTNNTPFGFNNTQSGSSYTNGDIFACRTPPFQSGYNPQGAGASDICGCTNWDGIASPSGQCIESSPYWLNAVLPNITWMKQGCPSCYAYPYDDKSSSYTCDSAIPGSGVSNAANYTVTFCPTGT